MKKDELKIEEEIKKFVNSAVKHWYKGQEAEAKKAEVMQDFLDRFKKMSREDQEILWNGIQDTRFKSQHAYFITNKTNPDIKYPLYSIVMPELPKLKERIYKESYMMVVNAARVGYLGEGIRSAKEFPKILERIPVNQRGVFAQKCLELVANKFINIGDEVTILSDILLEEFKKLM